MSTDHHSEHLDCGCELRTCQTVSRLPARCGRCGNFFPLVGRFDWPTSRKPGESFALMWGCDCGWTSSLLATVVAA